MTSIEIMSEIFQSIVPENRHESCFKTEDLLTNLQNSWQQVSTTLFFFSIHSAFMTNIYNIYEIVLS